MGRGMVGERGNFFFIKPSAYLVGATQKTRKFFGSGESRGSGYLQYSYRVYYILNTYVLRPQNS